MTFPAALAIRITCAGNHQRPEPNAAIPRQVDARVSLYLWGEHLL